MNPLAKWFLIIGGALTLGGPAIGLLGTVFGMTGSFDTLKKQGVSDPEALASNIGQSLMSTAGGFVIGFIGFLILVAGIIILLATRSKKVPPPIPQQ
ncbi:MAG: MotA/TolQ/ExbB proton channel family protein [Spartobacteria bacterium]